MMGRWILFGICLCEGGGGGGCGAGVEKYIAGDSPRRFFSFSPEKIILARFAERATNILPAPVLSRGFCPSRYRNLDGK